MSVRRMYPGKKRTTASKAGGPGNNTFVLSSDLRDIQIGKLTIQNYIQNRSNSGAALTLRSDNPASTVEFLRFDSRKAAADNDIQRIGFYGLDDAGTSQMFGHIDFVRTDVTSGTTDAEYGFYVDKGGADVRVLQITSSAGGAVTTNVQKGDMTITDGSLSVTDNDNANTLQVTNNTITTTGADNVGGMVSFVSTSLTTGNLLDLQLTEATLNGGAYIRAWDATAGDQVFAVKEGGATTIAGIGGNKMLTVSTGDVLIGDGSIAVIDADNETSFSLTNHTITNNNLINIISNSLSTGNGFSLSFNGLTSGSVISIATTGIHISSTTSMIIDMPVPTVSAGFSDAAQANWLPYGKKGASGMIVTEFYVDLTGVASVATDLDIIGDSPAGDNASIGQITTAIQGTVQAIEMVCLEAPAGGDADIDLYSAVEGTATETYDYLITSATETALITAGGDWTAGAVKAATVVPGANEYLYLVAGSGLVAGTYTAGKFVIRIYGT